MKKVQIWKLEYPNLTKEQAYKKIYPGIVKYLNKNIMVVQNDYDPVTKQYLASPYRIYGKLKITNNSKDGEFTVRSLDKKSVITFDSGNITEIEKRNGQTYFVLRFK